MLTEQVLAELKTFGSLERGNSQSHIIATNTVQGMIERGQKLYSFNRDRSGIEITVFVGWIENLNGHKTAVLSKDDSTHPSDLFVSSYVTRDILLSTRGTYDSECFFIEEDTAKRKLKRYIKKQLEKQLENLS